MTAVILVSAIVITVLGAKPNKPDTGKPEEPPVTVEAGFKIWIGIGDLGSPEDVVLQPYGEPEIDYLFIEKWDEGLWPPLSPTKVKVPEEEGGAVFIGAVNLAPGEEPEYSGTYDIADQDLIDVLEDIGFYPIKDQDTLCLMMVRYKGTFGQGKTKTEVDYWRFTIQWQIGTYEPENPEDGSGHPLVYQLEGETEKGPESEAEYDEANDSWTMFFNNVNFKFEENLAEPGWVLNTLWEGPLSFTVEIQRISQ